MGPLDEALLRAGVGLIDLVGGLLIAGYVAAALASLLRRRPVARARLLVGEGAVLGLSFKVAGTLLKTIDLHTWEQIAMFTAILALRIVLKQLFTWENARLRRPGPDGQPTATGSPVRTDSHSR